MANVTILGAGVMGSALAITAAQPVSNKITLVGSPLDNAIVESINKNRWHPTLQVKLPDSIICVSESEIKGTAVNDADIIVIGVSSPGVTWAVEKILQLNINPAACIALITKGLVAGEESHPPLTYADALADKLNRGKLLGIGGPCIARELAFGIPTFVTFASENTELAKQVRNVFQTDYYRIAVHHDFVGLEACAALKNFYCIGVSAMLGAWEIEGQTAKNPVAALFNQAVLEMNLVCHWIRRAGRSNTYSSSADTTNVAFDLPGMGDLHVTVGGGRNSRLGTLLGQRQKLADIVIGPMKGVTVEGLDTGRQLLHSFKHAVNTGALQGDQLPLTLAILNSIENNAYFEFDFAGYTGNTLSH